MCRSCKVIADVHRRPRLGLESFASSATPTAWADASDAHSAVDEVLESWSEAACGKAFLALTDLINFENDIQSKEQKEKERQSCSVSTSVSASPIGDGHYHQDHHDGLTVSPSSMMDATPLSILLSSEDENDRHQQLKPSDFTPSKLDQGVCSHECTDEQHTAKRNNDALLMSMLDQSSLAYVIQSLIERPENINTISGPTYNSPLGSRQSTTAVLHPYHQLTPSSTPCLSTSTLTGSNDHYHHHHNHGHHDNHMNNISDDVTTDEEQLNRFLNGLLQYSTTASCSPKSDMVSTPVAAVFPSAFTTTPSPQATLDHSATSLYDCCCSHQRQSDEQRAAVLHNFFVDTLHDHQQYRAALEQPPMDLSPDLITASSIKAQPPLQAKQPRQVKLMVKTRTAPAITKKATETFDFTVFKKHPLCDYMKDVDVKRYALIENARQQQQLKSNNRLQIDGCCNGETALTSHHANRLPTFIKADAPPLKYYQYFWRVAVEGNPDKAVRCGQRQRVLLLNLSTVANRYSPRSIVIENGKLLVRLPTTTSRDFIGWTATPALLDHTVITNATNNATASCTKRESTAIDECKAGNTTEQTTEGSGLLMTAPQPQQNGGRRKRAISEDMITISKMSRREVLNEILSKCASCNMKELDILLSSFVASHSQSLTTPQLRQLLHVIGAVPKHHLFSWISGQAELPTRRLAPLTFFEKKTKKQSCKTSTGSSESHVHHSVLPATTSSTEHQPSPVTDRRSLRGLSNHSTCSANEWRENFVAGQLLLAYVNGNHPLLRRFRHPTSVPASPFKSQEHNNYTNTHPNHHNHRFGQQHPMISSSRLMNALDNDKRSLSVSCLTSCSTKSSSTPTNHLS